MPLRKNPNDIALARSISLPMWMWDVIDDRTDALHYSRSELVKELLLPAVTQLKVDKNNAGV